MQRTSKLACHLALFRQVRLGEVQCATVQRRALGPTEVLKLNCCIVVSNAQGRDLIFVYTIAVVPLPSNVVAIVTHIIQQRCRPGLAQGLQGAVHGVSCVRKRFFMAP